MDMSKTALLLIDLQKEGGTSDVVGMEAILANAASLVDKCRQLGIPVIYTRHINRGDGLGLANEEPVNEAGEPIYYHSKTSTRSEEHTSELQSRGHLVCRLLLEKKKKKTRKLRTSRQ